MLKYFPVPPERRVAAPFFCTTIFQFMHAFFLISRRLSRREEEYLRQDCQNHRNATNQKLEIYIPISITKYGMQSRVCVCLVMQNGPQNYEYDACHANAGKTDFLTVFLFSEFFSSFFNGSEANV